MPKKSTLEVKESLSTLKSLLRSQTTASNTKRIQSLICIKTSQFEKRTDLAAFLGYNVRTMELWLKTYRDHGIEQMLAPTKKKQVRRRLVGRDIHQGLSERLNDPRKGFMSYVDAHRWVMQTYGSDIKYNTLRNYMMDFFGTRIKRPRKSHVKKSEEAKADFLKPSIPPGTD